MPRPHADAQRAFGDTRPLRQFANDVLRQRGRRPGPAVGQEVDEDPFARGHGVDGRPSRQRQPDRRAIGIAPRRADIVGHRLRQFVDRNVHRTLEADHDDRAGGGDLGFDVLGKLQHQPGVTAGGRKRRLALDRVGLSEPGRATTTSSRRGRERSTAMTAGRRQYRAVRANARPSDQIPAAAVRPIPKLLSASRSGRGQSTLAFAFKS